MFFSGDKQERRREVNILIIKNKITLLVSGIGSIIDL